MSKDPAFLFYYQDFAYGTRKMTFEEKGAYIELLCEQADLGKLSLDDIKRTLKNSFSIWDAICCKFIVDDQGFYYNEILKEHIEKRKNYVKSRRNNLKGSDMESHIDSHMESHMVNVNVNRNRNKKEIEKGFYVFWKTYPKKKSKGQAEKAFYKINPDEQLLETIISQIEQAKTSEDWIKEKGKYIPHPATWLNAKGWEDEACEAHPLSGVVSDKTIKTVTMLDNWRPPA